MYSCAYLWAAVILCCIICGAVTRLPNDHRVLAVRKAMAVQLLQSIHCWVRNHAVALERRGHWLSCTSTSVIVEHHGLALLSLMVVNLNAPSPWHAWYMRFVSSACRNFLVWKSSNFVIFDVWCHTHETIARRERLISIMWSWLLFFRIWTPLYGTN